MGGYPLPPTEPAGGWKNNAQWIGNVQYWAEDQMMHLGYTPDQIYSIYTKHTGEPFPKNLKASIGAKQYLFPGADMMYEYDLTHNQKRHYTYNDPANPGAQKGPFDWQPMDPSEIATSKQYNDWKNDPAHAWMIKDSGDNPYAAWMAQWSDKYKVPGWNADMFPNPNGQKTNATDILGRPGYGPGVGQVPDPTVKPTPTPTPTPGPAPGGDRPGPGNIHQKSQSVSGLGGGDDTDNGDAVSRVPGLFSRPSGSTIPGLARGPRATGY